MTLSLYLFSSQERERENLTGRKDNEAERKEEIHYELTVRCSWQDHVIPFARSRKEMRLNHLYVVVYKLINNNTN